MGPAQQARGLDRASYWFNSNSYIAKRLTGEYILDHHSASQCDLLYDIHAHDWYRPWCEDVMPGLALPRLPWPTEVIGQVTPAAADATGLPAGTPVCAGTVDAWAEAFSAGVRRPGDLMLMYGSTMFFVQVLQSLAPHPKLWTTVGVDPGTYTLAAGMATSGSLTSWVQDLVGGVPFERLVEEAAAVRAWRRRFDHAAVLRRGAYPDLRPTRPGSYRRSDPPAQPRAPVPRRL